MSPLQDNSACIGNYAEQIKESESCFKCRHVISENFDTAAIKKPCDPFLAFHENVRKTVKFEDGIPICQLAKNDSSYGYSKEEECGKCLVKLLVVTY